MINKERKIDTRNKIELGGLIIKAKLGYLQEKHKEVILGALIDAFNKIHDSHTGEQNFQLYKNIGHNDFNKKSIDTKESTTVQASN